MRKSRLLKIRTTALVAVACIGIGCSQTTHSASTYRQTVTTRIEINTSVPAAVWINDRPVGTTPITFPFNYEEEVDRSVRNANYWETNPGWAAAVTVLSFGTYLPLSLIPAEPTSQTRPSGRFVDHKATIRLTAENFEPFEQTIECKGEGKIILNVEMKPKV